MLGAEGQPVKLLFDARSCFEKLAQDHPAARQDKAGHGRKETCIGTVISDKSLAEHQNTPGLKAFGRIESRRETGGIVPTETRHFALSWTPAPEAFMATVRGFLGPRPLGDRERPALAA